MKKAIIISLLTILFLQLDFFAYANSADTFSLPSFFSDGMVLQQNTDARLWGRASAGSTVRIKTSWNGAEYSAIADTEGRWRVNVSTPTASYQKHSVNLSCGKHKIVINDVLVGEVWFASGQSNMYMLMLGYKCCPVRGYLDVVSSAPAKEKIRMFSVKPNQSYEPLEDTDGSWKGACSENIPDMSATAYFFARKLNEMLDVPVGIIASAYGGARVEGWTPKDIMETYDEDLSREAIEKMNIMYRPYLIYNAMLNPVKGYSIKGFIWYQGCSNVGHEDVFVDRMSKMVSRWREDWEDYDASLPFYTVEIAPLERPSDLPRRSEFRIAQHIAAKEIPNSGIVVTNDLVDEYEKSNIHPSRKREVGERLAFLALNRDYGFKRIPCYYPEAVSIKKGAQTNEFVVSFDNLSVGVGRLSCIEGLEALDADGNIEKIESIKYLEEKQFHVFCKQLSDPVELRYGWGAYRPGNLITDEGLPFSPFDLKITE